MPPLRPVRWLIHAPLAILPFLAAVFIQGAAPDALGMSYLPAFTPLLAHHWYWLAVALGLGVWVGWYTASERPPGWPC